jgi:hypothetical protein
MRLGNMREQDLKGHRRQTAGSAIPIRALAGPDQDQEPGRADDRARHADRIKQAGPTLSPTNGRFGE